MIIYYFLAVFLITLFLKKSKLLYYLLLFPYFYIIFNGRSFGIDDTSAYHQSYLSGEYTIQFGFLEFALPQIFNFLRVFDIQDLRTFNITMVFLEVSTLFFLLVKDRQKFLIFLTTICAAPFIINSGLFIRQVFSSTIIIYGLLLLKNNYYYVLSLFFHNTSIFFYIINKISKLKFLNNNYSLLFLFFLLSYIFQPFDQQSLLNIFSYFSYEKTYIWETNIFEINRLPFTSFLMPYFFMCYVFLKKRQNKLFSFFFGLIIITFLFGKVPFLASRLGLIPIIFSPYLLYQTRKSNKVNMFDNIMLFLYFIYTTIVFLYKDETFFYFLFNGVY